MSNVMDWGIGGNYLKKKRQGEENARKKQEQLIAKQKQEAAADLAESEGEVAYRRALVRRKGMGRSLLAAKPTGQATTMGGTNG